MTKIIRSPEYFADLVKIDDYYSLDKDLPQVALSIIRGIEHAVDLLETTPLMGKQYCFGGLSKCFSERILKYYG